MSRAISEIDADIKLYENARKEYKKFHDDLDYITVDHGRVELTAEEMRDGLYEHYDGNNEKVKSSIKKLVQNTYDLGDEIETLMSKVSAYIGLIDIKLNELRNEHTVALNSNNK